MRVRTVGSLTFLLAAAGLLARAQDGVPQFRGGVALIPIDVTVLDDKRHVVRGLAASDFTVLDNGVAKPIRAFSAVELAPRVGGTEAAWSATVPPDVTTNASANEEGRLVVILMDRSIPPQEPMVAARRIAKAAIDELGPNDLGAVVSTNNGSVHDATIQNFTADRTRLKQAIDRQNAAAGISQEAQSVWAAVGLTFDPHQDGGCLCGLCVLETMTRVADAVRDTPRRRKLLLFIGSDVIWQSMRKASDNGADTGCERPLADARKALFKAVDRANLTVHSIDPRGLLNVGPQTRASIPNQAVTSRAQQQQAEMNDVLISQQNLRQLPDRTGGRTITGRNDAEEIVGAIYRESEAYYLLGIERDPSTGADAPRSIEVKVGRRGLRVVSQRAYQPAPPATGAGTAGPLDALTRLMPRGDLPLTLSVSPVAGAGSGQATVRINVDAGAFARTATAPVPLDVTVMATDRTGRAVASARQRSTITVSGASNAAPIEVNVPVHLELPAGDYGIRVAIVEASTARTASVFSDVAVADFARDPLSLSGMTVDAAPAAGTPSETTTRRSFRRTDQVRAALQIYQGTQRTEPIAPVSMRVQILDAKGTAVRDQTLPFAEQAFNGRRADCLITLPLASLAPGEYLLKLEASLGRETEGRAMRFIVE